MSQKIYKYKYGNTKDQALDAFKKNLIWMNSFDWNNWNDSFPCANKSDLEFEIVHDFKRWVLNRK